MEELKNCPFCGSNEILVHTAHFAMDNGPRYHVRCKRCPCELTWSFTSMEDLTAAWNRREKRGHNG